MKILFYGLLTVALASSAVSQERQKLWPDGAPGAKGLEAIDQPFMDVYLPDAQDANGCGVVIFPGGGYGGLAADHEGHQIARYFNDFGVAAFVVYYRLGSNGYHHPTQINDARRAIRSVRANAKEFGVDPQRIGSMGFSAGGHLCSMTGTMFDSGMPNAVDPVERSSSRPDFLVLCYPVISLSTEYAHGGTRRNLFGENVDPESYQVRLVSTELQIKADTPPTFLFHTGEDPVVPVENSVLFYLGLRKHGIPAEMHIYQKGPHGVGLMPGDPILETWGGHLRGWLSTNQFLGKGKRVPVSGTVMLNSTPVSWGSVSFYPEGKWLPITTLRVRNGKFRATEKDGPIAGLSRVEFYGSIYEATKDPRHGTVSVSHPSLVEISPDAKLEFSYTAPSDES
tara:strand:+ start:6154 stop:7341 length:1188 start_codon:yes stop_codon:yes gene_type:complete